MRVIAGQYRSRPLRSLRGMETRPTSDRLRETLFNVLTAGNPEALAGTTWLDLFAGTGAVGIEALSRGAARVTFVESAKAAAGVIRENLASLGIEKGFEVMQAEVEKVLGRASTAGADFIFVDPPYRDAQAYRSTLERLGRGDVAGEATLVIVEHDTKFDPGESFGGLHRVRKVRQGDTALSFYRWSGRATP